MSIQLYDKAEEYKMLYYNKKPYRQEEFKEKLNSSYKVFFDFETITSGDKHMPYLCWMYNDDIQQECIGVENCATDRLNALPTGKNEMLSIAHNSDYDSRFSLKYIDNVKPIIRSNRFLQIKATYYNPVQKIKIKLKMKDSYKLISMPLRGFGDCFRLDVSKEVMPYYIYLNIYL